MSKKDELTFEVAANRLPTKCTLCGRDIPPGLYVIPWRNGYRDGNVHPMCAVAELDWNGRCPEPPLVWDHNGQTRFHQDLADLYEFLPNGTGGGGPRAGWTVMKNGVHVLCQVPIRGVPTTISPERQAKLMILSEMDVAFLPSRNERARKAGLVRRAEQMLNEPTHEMDVRADDPDAAEVPTAKEPAMAKSFLSKSAVATRPGTASTKPAASAPGSKGPSAKGGGAAQAKKTNPDAGVKRNPVALTDDEIAAAVSESGIRPRDYTGDKKQDALTAIGEGGKPAGRPLGLTTGLPIMGWFCYAFQQNEKTPAQCKIPGLGRQPDSEIVKAVHKEFPGRTSKLHENPQTIRVGYNKGVLTRNVLPKIQSRRFDDAGNPMEGRAPKGSAAEATTPVAKAPAAAAAKPAKAAVATKAAPSAKKVLRA